MKKKTIIDILKVIEDLSHIKDIDSLLESVLYEARKITNADAGSIFLKSENHLTFEYVQNDTLYGTEENSNDYLYSKRKIFIDNKSIAGYVTQTKKPLVINNVYKIDKKSPYSFNKSFDAKSSYHTGSMLTVPLITSREKVIGVIQIINAKNYRGKIISFTKDDEFLVSLFAAQAAVAVEKALMTREIILRMIKIAELRDPLETGVHVNRVGAISVEIYKKWAVKEGIPKKEITRNKDILRIAAMLHDVGKVAISDVILKKKGKLNEMEFEMMKFHTVHGARLFKDSNSEWDDMAVDITLNHHEKWDGTGYPGNIKNIYNDNLKIMPGKKGTEIPLFARIVALADVYDALMSSRLYKRSWPEDRVLKLIEKESGKHFDPNLVEVFFDIQKIITSIREKYN
ncbi:MAG: HD domain-containing phosphohydrolase [Acidobacteriota bacterium]